MTQDLVIGYVHGDLITQEFHHCLMSTWIQDLMGPRRILNFAPQYSGCQISGARNQMVTDFLAQDEAQWLMIFDSDATFSPDLIHVLLNQAETWDIKVLGALAHRIRGSGEPPILAAQGQIRDIIPVAYKQTRDEDGEWVGYQELTMFGQGLLEVDATGCHALLVHREVFEKIHSDHPHRWFRESVLKSGVLAGEDITFCLAARDAGYQVFVDTLHEAGHIKSMVLTSQGAS